MGNFDTWRMVPLDTRRFTGGDSAYKPRDTQHGKGENDRGGEYGIPVGSVIPLPRTLAFPTLWSGKAPPLRLVKNTLVRQIRHTDHKGDAGGTRYAASSQNVYRQKKTVHGVRVCGGIAV